MSACEIVEVRERVLRIYSCCEYLLRYKTRFIHKQTMSTYGILKLLRDGVTLFGPLILSNAAFMHKMSQAKNG